MTRVQKKRDYIIQTIVLVFYVLFMVYYFYRYAFKYNSESTSPTYSNTPMAFQLGKYAIVVLFVLLVGILFVAYNYRFRARKLEVVLLVSFIIIALKSLVFSDFDFIIKFFIFLIPAYSVIFIKNDKLFIKRFVKVNKYLLVYFVLYSFLQIALYLLIGRLPALGYAGSLVRFGGPWDDPNSFALYLIIPIAYYGYNYLSKKRNRYQNVSTLLILLLLLVLELLTFSFAGYLALFILAIALLKAHLKSGRTQLIAFVAFVFVCLAAIVLREYIINIINAKGDSVLIHLKNMIPTIYRDNKVLGFFIGNREYVFLENMYNQVFANFGIFVLIGYVCMIVYICRTSFIIYKFNRNEKTFTMFLYILCFSICQVGIPYAIIFPVNFIYWVLAFYSIKYYRQKYCPYFKKAKVKPAISLGVNA